MVHAGISIDERTDLHVIPNGTLTGRQSRDEILRPLDSPYPAAIGGELMLMDDNCRPHRSNLVNDFLLEEGIIRIEWPVFSRYEPDRAYLGHSRQRVSGRLPPPQTLQELERALQEEWGRIPQPLINSLIDSMPQRCFTLLGLRGYHTLY
ncbi:uncharacterized protein LOC129231183 [Uloborus diversus]|uniref:uncharacterized protein LOC129231183 n=1 Tax=Uloborus diversus TaxID=327109 RepID=UPI00240A3003|nr:uncharacterized protein LOC129231183 [Uloborus diversus]